MLQDRKPGDIKIDREWYRIARDRNNQLLYQRKTLAKPALNIRTNTAFVSEAGIIEHRPTFTEGFGNAIEMPGRDSYHFGMNVLVTEGSEVALLPRPLYTSTVLYGPPVAVFELNVEKRTVTYVLQDFQLMTLGTVSPPSVQYSPVAFFPYEPSDAAVFQNTAYLAFGGSIRPLSISSVADNGSGQPRFTTGNRHFFKNGNIIRIQNSSVAAYNGQWTVTVVDDFTFDVPALTYQSQPSYSGTCYRVQNGVLRRFRAMETGNQITFDSSAYLSVTSVADNGSGKARFTTNFAHGFSPGTTVYLFDFNVASYNSLSTTWTSTLYTVSAVPSSTTFDIDAITFNGNATGAVKPQDSDVYAEHLTVVGDLLVRAYQDADGWKISRVDAINSNPLLEANWTAGIGTLSVGSATDPVTDLVTMGDGEVVLKADGVFVYSDERGLYVNEIPELEHHRHRRNGRGAIAYKGWLYIPTAIGLFRWQTGIVENVTPGKEGTPLSFTPIGPAGWLAGDTEALYVWQQPFQVHQNKTLTTPSVRMYVDYTGTGDADDPLDWNSDPSISLYGMTAAGALYVGSTEPWHRMFFEVDPLENGLNEPQQFRIDAVLRWDGTDWVTEAFVDYTRKRSSAGGHPNSFAIDGNVVVLTDLTDEPWPKGGTVGGTIGSLNNNYYWRKFVFTSSVTTRIFINRAIAGRHDETIDQYHRDLPLASGGVQHVLRFEERGSRQIWHTTWAFSEKSWASDFDNGALWVGGASPAGAAAIIQPNALRADTTGSRWLFLGGYHLNYLCPLGTSSDPFNSEAPYHFHTTGSPEWVLVLSETSLGLPDTPKHLLEVTATQVFNEFLQFNKTFLIITKDANGNRTVRSLSLPNVPVPPDGSRHIGLYRTGTTTVTGDFTSRLSLVNSAEQYPALTYTFVLIATATQFSNAFTSIPKLRNFIVRALPRPLIIDTINVTLELDDTQLLRGATVHQYPYRILNALVEHTKPVTVVDPSGRTFSAIIQTMNERFVEGAHGNLQHLLDLEIVVLDAIDAVVQQYME